MSEQSKTHWKQEITLPRLKELLHYEPSTGKFRWIASRRCVVAGSEAGTVNSYGYVMIKVDGILYGAHRLAWLWMTGVLPTVEIDHRNRIRSDNKFGNLRPATPSQNRWNASLRCDNTSGVKGVSYSKERGKYLAQIAVGGKNRNLGRFENIEDAIAAYKSAAESLHGEFAATEGC